MPLPQKFSIAGTPVSSTTYADVVRAILTRSPEEALVVACCNVHSVMSARRNPDLANSLAGAQIATPDGMPLVWALNVLYGQKLADRVYGPDLMLAVMSDGRSTSLAHFLLGGTEATLTKLTHGLASKLDGVIIAGTFSPPFASLDEMDIPAMVAAIARSGAEVIWLGLGMPKQELLMHRIRGQLPGRALVGVGAAFDFHAGNVPQAPEWMQRRGLEWAYRLSHEPRRLFGRYFWNNPAFLVWFGWERVRQAIRPSTSS